ncbi:MAG: molybdenum cofactor guanylyltransferase [Rhodothermales bacterium]
MATPLKSPSGLVLAGGRSARFGSDKALALVDGRPMIRQVFETLAGIAQPVFVSVGDAATTYDLPARHVADRYPGCGPLGGIHAGLLASPAEWMLVVPCDMPDLDAASLKKLLKARTADGDAVVAVDPAGRPVPVVACYHRRALARIEARLAGPDLSLHGLLDLLDVVTVRLNERALRNINTPADAGV